MRDLRDFAQRHTRKTFAISTSFNPNFHGLNPNPSVSLWLSAVDTTWYNNTIGELATLCWSISRDPVVGVFWFSCNTNFPMICGLLVHKSPFLYSNNRLTTVYGEYIYILLYHKMPENCSAEKSGILPTLRRFADFFLGRTGPPGITPRPKTQWPAPRGKPDWDMGVLGGS